MHKKSMVDHLTFDGRKFISSSQASRLTGYTSDYIGQLCRGRKLSCRRIGKVWYVEEENLLFYKSLNLSKDPSKAVRLNGHAKKSIHASEHVSEHLPVAHEILMPATPSAEEVKQEVHAEVSAPEMSVEDDAVAPKIISEPVQADEKVLEEIFSVESASISSTLPEVPSREVSVDVEEAVADEITRAARKISPRIAKAVRSPFVKSAILLKAGTFLLSTTLVFGMYHFTDTSLAREIVSETGRAVRSVLEVGVQFAREAAESPVAARASIVSSAREAGRFSRALSEQTFAALTEEFAPLSCLSHGCLTETSEFIAKQKGAFSRTLARSMEHLGAAVGSSTTFTRRALTPVEELAKGTYRTLSSLIGRGIERTRSLSVKKKVSAPVAVATPTATPETPQAPTLTVRERETIVTGPSTPSVPPTVVEKTTERIVIGDISRTEVDQKLTELQARLAKDITQVRTTGVQTAQATANNTTYINNVYNTVAQTNNLDRVQDLDLIDPEITGGTMTNTSISGVRGSFTSLSGGNLSLSSTLNVTGTLTNSDNLGIGTTSPGGRLSIAGAANSATPLLLISTSTPEATSTALIVTGSGNFGLSSSSPTSRLSIAAAIDQPAAFITQTGNGYVLYAEDSADDTTPVVIDGSGNVGIGTKAPSVKLHVSDGNTASSSLITSDPIVLSYQNTAPGFSIISAASSPAQRAVFKGVRSRGTLESPTVPLENDDVLTFLAAAFDGLDTEATAGVFFKVDGTVATNTAPQRISFVTSTSTAAARTERLVIKSSGQIGISSTSPYAMLALTGLDPATTTMAIRPAASQTANILDVYDTAGTLSTVLTSGHKFGLGTTSPWGQLSVNPDNISGPAFVVGSTTSTFFAVGNNGTVSIGTSTAPLTALLAIVGDSSRVGTEIAIQNTRSGGRNWRLGDNVGSAAAGRFSLRDDTSGITRFLVDTNGFFGIASNTPWGALSVVSLSTATAPAFVVSTSTLTSTSTAFIVGANGKVGVGTTTPAYDFSVAGTGFLDGNLILGGAGSSLTFTGTGNHDITASGGTLRIGSNTIIGDIQALNSSVDIGTADTRFDKIYANEVNASTLVGTIVGGNVSAETLSINSDNGTADLENANLAFHRGLSSPNALLTWDQSNDEFDFNSTLHLTSTLSNASSTGITFDGFTTDITTGTNEHFAIMPNGTGNVGIGTTTPWAKLSLAALSSNTAPLFTLSTSTLTSTSTAFIVGANGKVGVGTSSPTYQLSLTGNLALPNTTGTTTGTILFGDERFIHNYGSSNAFLGQTAGNFTMTGIENIGIGTLALRGMTSGSDNVGIGYNALTKNTAGSYNVSLGAETLASNTTGDKNIALGYLALTANTTGTTSIAIGYSALEGNTTGARNIGIGESALIASNGSGNIAQGYRALNGLTTGSLNVAIGDQAGSSISDLSNSILIGASTGQTGVESLTNAIAIGYGALVEASNTFILGGLGSNAVDVGIGTSSPYGLLSLNPDGISGPAFVVGSSTATYFTIGNGGKVTIGTTTATSSPTTGLADAAFLSVERSREQNTTVRIIGGSASRAALEVRSRDEGGPSSGVIAHFTDEFKKKGLTFTYSTTTTTFRMFSDYFAGGGSPSPTLTLGTYETQTNHLNLTTNGRVGVGTTTPGAALAVSSIGLTSAPVFLVSTSTLTSTSTALIIDANGQVGVGTTSPYAQLSVAGIGAFDEIHGGGGTFTVKRHSVGRVGIGTTSPAEQLHLSQVATNGSNGIRITNTASGGEDVALRVGATGSGAGEGNFALVNNYSTVAGGVVRFVLSSGGLVGIGTTSPATTLSVQGNALISGNISSVSSITATSTVTGATFVGTDAAATSTLAGGLAIETSGFVYDYSSGKVGIGTAAPAYNIDVVGNSNNTIVGIRGQDNDFSTNGESARVRFSGNDDTFKGTVGYMYRSSVSDAGVFLSSADDIYFEVNGATTPSHVFTSAGLVGIGTTTPNSLLSVSAADTVNSASTTLLTLDHYSTSANPASGIGGGILFRNMNSASSTVNAASIVGLLSTVTSGSESGELAFYTRTSGGNLTERLRIDDAGNVGIGSTSPTAALDVSSSAYPVARFERTSSVTNAVRGVLQILHRTSGDISTDSYGTALDFAIGDVDGTNIVAGLRARRDGADNSGVLELLTTNSGTSAVRLGVTSSGLVGIGTTTPGKLLSVHGDALVSGTLSVANLIATSSTITLSGLGTDMLTALNSSGNLVATSTPVFGSFFATSTTATSTILGKLGIGTSSPSARLEIGAGNSAAAGTNEQLTIQTTGSARLWLNADTDNVTETENPCIGFGQDGTTNFSSSRLIGLVGNADADCNNGTLTGTLGNALLIDANNAGAIQFNVGATTFTGMTLDTSGNLGIGTTSPYAKLSVEGSSALGNSATAGYFTATTSTASVFPYASTTAISSSGAGYINNLAVGTYAAAGQTAAPSNGLIVSGSVGIGTTSPISTLTLSQTPTGTEHIIRIGLTDYITASSNRTMTIGPNQISTVFTNSTAANAPLYIQPLAGAFDTKVTVGTTTLEADLNTTMIVYGSGITTNRTFATRNSNNTETFTILDSGLVGIGTTSPGARLEIADQGTSASPLMNIRADDANPWQLNIMNDTYDNASDIRGLRLFVADDGTGRIYAPDNAVTPGNLELRTDEATRMTILGSNGNVGIGTTSPASKLSVQGNALISGTLSVANLIATSSTITFSGLGTNMLASINASGNLVATSTPTAAYYLATSSIASIFPYASTTALSASGAGYINNLAIGSYAAAGQTAAPANGLIVSGNVGIGTTSPRSSLNVFRDDSLTTGLSAGSIIEQKGSGDATQTFLISDTLAYVMGIDNSDSDKFKIGASSAGFDTSTLFTMTSGGNVGIGTTSPGQKLSVAGDILGNNIIGSYFTGTSTSATSTLAGGLAIETSGFVYDYSSGNVGIGTAAPSGKLEIAGTETADESRLIFSASDFSDRFTIETDLDTTSTNDILGFRSSNADNILILRGNGNVGVGSSTPNTKLVIAGDTRLTTIGTGDGIFADNGVAVGIFSLTRQDTVAAGDLSIAAYGGIGLTGGSTAYDNAVSSGYDLYITSAGNVGIGTTSPATTLSVQGNALISGNLSSVSSITATSTVTGATFVGTDAAATSTLAGGLAIETSGFVYDYSSGNVGIGTAAAAEKLQIVGGNIALDNQRFYKGKDTGGTIRSIVGTDSSDYSVIRSITSGVKFQSIAGSDLMTLLNAGSLGIGTTSPWGKLSVAVTAANTGPLFSISTSTLTSTSTAIHVDSNGKFGIGTTSPYAQLSVAGTAAFDYFNANGTAGTSTISGGLNVGSGAITYDYSAGLTTIQNAQVGASTFESDAGILTWIDLPISSSAAASTVESYTANIDGNALLTVYGEADGSGNAQNLRVGIGTSTPFAKLSVAGNGTGTGYAFAVSDVASTTRFVIQDNGKVGLSTTTPGAKLAIDNSSTGVGLYLAGYANSAADLVRISTSTASATSTAFVINSNGKVGIGTSSPFARLSIEAGNSVDQGVWDSGLLIKNSASATGAEEAATAYQSGSTGTNYWFTGINGSSNYQIGYGGSFTNGASYLALTTTGRVGVATTTPGSTFSVHGNALISGNLSSVSSITATSTVTGATFVGTNAAATSTLAGGLAIETSGFVYDYSTGNVGIGITTSSAKLQIRETTARTAFTGTGYGTFALENLAGTDDYTTLDFSGGSSTGNAQSRIASIQTASGSFLQFGTSNSYASGITNTAMTINPSGNVGIGTTTPQWLLNPTSASASQLALSAGAGIAQWAFRNAGGNFYLSTTTTNGTATTSISAFTILESSGNIGIGVAAPGAKLQVGLGSLFTTELTPNIQSAISDTTDTGSVALLLNINEGVNNPRVQFFLDDNTNTYGFRGSAGVTRPEFVVHGASGAEKFRVTNTGSVGIGTTSPWAKLSVAVTAANTGPLFSISTSTLTATSTAIHVDSNGKFGIGTTSPYAQLSVAGTAAFDYFNANGTAGTSTISGGFNVGNGAITYDYSSGLTSIANAEFGATSFDSDAGMVSWIDMPVTSSASAGTIESYTARLDGNPLFTVYGLSDGSGGVSNTSVSIGTTTPYSRFSVWGAGTGTGQLFALVNSASTTVMQALDNGKVGIASTSPWGLFSVNPDGLGTGIPEFVIGSSTATRLIVTGSGNVGIGTTSPLSQNVASAVNFLNLSTAAGAGTTALVLNDRDSTQESTIYTTGAGLYFDVAGHTTASNNFLAFRTEETASSFGATERMRIDSAGNVGIGTTSPLGKLNVYAGASGVGTANTAGDDLIVENSNDGGISILTPAANSSFLMFGSPSDNFGAGMYWNQTNDLFTLGTANSGADFAIITGDQSEAIRILDSGNVGIGTTTPGTRAPGTASPAYSAGKTLDINSGTTDPLLSLLDTQGTTGIQIWSDTSGGHGYFDSLYNDATIRSFNFRTRTMGTPVDALTILGSGNVGIGTTSPGSKLDVYNGASGGGAYSTADLTVEDDSDAMIQFLSLNTGKGGFFFGDAQSNTIGQFYFDHVTNKMILEAGGGPGDMVIDSSGNVGIGTTTPYSLLTLYTAGSTAATSPQLVFSASSTVSSLPLAMTNWSIGTNLASKGRFEIASSSVLGTNTRMVIDGAGNVGFGTTSPESFFVINNAGGTESVKIRRSGGAGSLTINVDNYLSASGADTRFTALPDSGTAASGFLFRTHTGSALQNSVAINGAGSLGVGSTTPWGKLSVTNTGSGPSFVVEDGTSPDSTPFIIDADGNVGIGTAAPTSALSFGTNAVVSRATSDGADNGYLEFSGGGAAASTRGAYLTAFGNEYSGREGELVISAGNVTNTGVIRFSTAGAEKVRIDTSGNVGIGTTTPSWKLQVTDTNKTFTSSNPNLAVVTSDAAAINVGGQIGLGGLYSAVNTGNAFYGFIKGAKENSTAGNPAGYLALGTSIASGGVTTEWMRINSSGNVGIGTTTPQWLLNPTSASASQLALSAGAGIAQWAFRNAGGNFYLATTTTNGTATSSLSALSILGSSGYVGIGIDVPTALLHLATPTLGTDMLYLRDNGAATDLTFEGRAGSIYEIRAGAGDHLSLSTDATSDNGILISSTGKVGIASTTPWGKLSVAVTAANTGPLFSISTSTLTSTSTAIHVDSNGKFGIGTTSPYAQLSVAGTAAFDYFNANGTAGTSTISGGFNVGNGALTYDFSTGLTSMDNLTLGATSFDSDAGIVSWIDMPVTSSASVGTVESYTAQIDGSPVLTAYAESDGGGGVRNLRVGIGTTTPGAALAIDNVGTTTVGFYLAATASASADVFRISTSTISATSTAIVVNSNGKLGVGTTSPWTTLAVSGAVALNNLTSSATGNAVCITTSKEITDAGGGTCTPSSERFKENIETLASGTALDSISRMRVVSFDYKDGYFSPEDGKASLGLVAEELEEIDPRLVDYGYDGQPLTLHFERLTGLTIQAIQEIARVIDLSGASTTVPSIVIASSTNIGIGTSTPEYKLHVIGDVAATSFVNISTRTAKKDIEYYDDSDRESVLEKMKSIGIAEYRYNMEDPTSPKRLGLIAEEAPVEVLSASGKGVDVYKLSTFILAGVQEQQKQIDSLELRVANLERLIASSTSSFNSQLTTSDSGGVISNLLNGATRFIRLAADNIFADHITVENVLAAGTLSVGSSDRPSGITLYDEVTKEPYCLTIANGSPKTTAGACTSAQPTTDNPQPTTDSQQPTTDNSQLSTDATAPVITLNGNNPAEVAVDASYADLGATVTDNHDANLGLYAIVNGVDVGNASNIQLNTGSSTTYTIEYYSVDQAGNRGSATRTVIVGNNNQVPSTNDQTINNNQETSNNDQTNLNSSNEQTTDNSSSDQSASNSQLITDNPSSDQSSSTTDNSSSDQAPSTNDQTINNNQETSNNDQSSSTADNSQLITDNSSSDQ